MFDTINRQEHKQDFFQLVGQVEPSNIAGCDGCGTTIFYNGRDWKDKEDGVVCSDKGPNGHELMPGLRMTERRWRKPAWEGVVVCLRCDMVYDEYSYYSLINIYTFPCDKPIVHNPGEVRT